MFVFFFKQKTAYEMRISDWSSDVCSSDLNLTPLYPDTKIKLEVEDPTIKDLTPRVIALTAPIGKGQRPPIAAPPRTGKTMIRQNIAQSIAKNPPETIPTTPLIDERPDTDTDMDRPVTVKVGGSTIHE